MDQTPNLLLPYIMAAQAQKHVTHNEAIRALDAIVQLSVADRDLATPPGAPTEGTRYIVAASPTGAWIGHTGHVAAFQDGAWAFYVPLEGWLAWIADEDILVSWTGTAWATASGSSINPAPLVGVNATADATNKLSVSSSAVLFNHIGNGTQVKVNKAALADTASFLFQTGFSGRAEIGTTGDDSFHFKVSPDGAVWKDAIIVDKTSGAVSMPFTSTGGSVTNVATGTGLTGGPITSNGTLSLANMPASTLKGNNTGAAAAPADLTPAQVRTLINVTDGANNYVHPSHTGDVTSVSDGATVIAANTVTNLKLADVPTQTFKGRTTAATGDPEDLTIGQAKALLNLTGSNTGDQTITLTADVTGSGAGSFAATIANNAVTNAKLADVPTQTFKGRTSAATGDPEDLTVAQAQALLGVSGSNTGDQTITLTSDVTGSGAGSFAATIANNAVTNAKLADVPTQTFKGRTTAATGDPEDLTVTQAQALLGVSGTNTGDQTITLTSDVTGTGTGSFAATIAANAVTNIKLADMAANSIKGNNTGAAGDPADLTTAQATALLDPFISSGAGSKKGLVPDPGSTSGATKFLREDAVWSIPAGTGGATAGGDGSAIVDFGTGTDTSAVTITGQSSIAASSITNAWIFAKDSADHSADEHIVEELDVRAGLPAAGTGFTITARTRNKPLRGQWTVAWSWR